MRLNTNILNYKNILFSLTLSLLLVISGLYKCDSTDSHIYTVEEDTFTKKIEVEGNIQAGDSKVVRAPSVVHGNTQIVEMVEEGTFVEEGDFLIQFDTTKFQDNLREARSKYNNAQASFRTTKANIEKQMADLKAQLQIEEYNLEQTRLRAENAEYEPPNKQKQIEYSLEKSKISYNRLKEKVQEIREINNIKLEKSQIKVEQARNEVEKTQDKIQKLTINAPAQGLVVYKSIWASNGRRKIQEGDTPWRDAPLLEIPSQGNRKVTFQVRETQISEIEKGLEVEVIVNALPDTTYDGQITKISSLANRDRETNNKVFDITAKLNTDSEALKPGMSAECTIIIKKINNAIFIPVQGLIRRNNRSGVLLASGEFKQVETGPSNDNLIVISDGLEAGDRIQLKSQNSTNNSTGTFNPNDIFSNDN